MLHEQMFKLGQTLSGYTLLFGLDAPSGLQITQESFKIRRLSKSPPRSLVLADMTLVETSPAV